MCVCDVRALWLNGSKLGFGYCRAQLLCIRWESGYMAERDTCPGYPVLDLGKVYFHKTCFIQIQIGFTFLVPAYPGYPGKEAIKLVSWVSIIRVCVSVCNMDFWLSLHHG